MLNKSALISSNRRQVANDGASSSSSSGSSNSTSSTSSSTIIKSNTSSKRSATAKAATTTSAAAANTMSNLSADDYLIDDDHIDDQETINVGNLIIDLESDLEKEKFENEQQAYAKPSTISNNNNTCSTTTKSSNNNTPSSSSSVSNDHHSSSSTSTTTTSSSASSTANSNSNNTLTSSSGGKGNKASSSTTGLIGGKSNQKVTSNKSLSLTLNNNSSSHLEISGNAINSSINNSSSSSNNNNNNGAGRSVFKSSSDERGELKMRITRETMPGKSDHKIVTSPNQKSPTSSSGNSHNNGGSSSAANVSSAAVAAYANIYEEALMQHNKSPSSKPTQSSNSSSSISSTKECGTSTSIGTITEPECLGPCEPGTSVTLEGIVWQETDGGILVVNVTWRGKTYVGALLDCTKHDWAPPRLCDSPASDIDSKTNKGVRPKRIVTRSNGIGLDEKNLLQTTGKLRNGKGRRILAPSDLASCSKRQRDSEKMPNENMANNQLETSSGTTTNESAKSNSENPSSVPMNIDITATAAPASDDSTSTSNITSDRTGPNSPMLIGCNEPNCSKKYRNMNGLLYHQTHAHSNDNDSSNSAQENNCSSSIKSKDVSKDDRLEETPNISIMIGPKGPSSPVAEHKHEQDVQKLPKHDDSKPELSPNDHNQRACKETAPDINVNLNIPTSQESRTPMMKHPDSERRTSSHSGHHLPDLGRKSPIASGPRHSSSDHGHGSGSYTPIKQQANSGGGLPPPKHQPAPPPMPPTTEEGMKPSGTSTGPPPAPHQANCYFNPAFLANNFNPYLSPYFPRMPLPPMYPDPLSPATSNAFLSRFMGPVRQRPPPTHSSESTSRMLSPSVPTNLPFPPFKLEPGMPPIPTSLMSNHGGPSAISPHLTHPPPPPLPGGSPHLRMPSQGDPLLPPTSQAPIPPNLNPLLGLPGPMNPLGPMGGPQVPSLVEDALAKQLPRRFN